MKKPLIIASDIHGREDTVKRLLEIERSIDSSAIILLGDILYHGPRNDIPPSYNPKGAIKLLESVKDKIIAVRGNCDAEVDLMVLPFDLSQNEREIEYEKLRITLTHGHHLDFSNLKSGKIILYGHTHIPEIKRLNKTLLINPGSISIPKNGFKESYAILGEGSLQIRELFSGKIIMKEDLWLF